MFTLHFILLLGFSTLQIAAAENAGNPKDPGLVNLRNDSGNMPISENSLPQSLTRSLGNEFSEDYDGEEFQDNRLRLMIQPKKPLTLNETKLRIWPANPNISSDVPVISYRNSFGIQSPEEGEISRNEITENTSKGNRQNSKDYEAATIIPTINITSEETALATAGAAPEQLQNENNLSPKSERTKAKADSKHVKLDLTDVTEESISNVTVLSGKFVASLSSFKNTSSPMQNEIIKNETITEKSTSTQKPGSESIQNDTTDGNPEQKEGTETSVSAGTDSRDENVQDISHLSSNSKNQTQDLENENFYEELEPDILSEENDTDYVTPKETAIDQTNTVLIVLPGSDKQKGGELTGTATFPGKPYISEAISQNLLHLLVNLTAITAVNERNGRKILRELQEQKGQLQSLKRQSDNIYNYITRIKNDHLK